MARQLGPLCSTSADCSRTHCVARALGRPLSSDSKNLLAKLRICQWIEHLSIELDVGLGHARRPHSSRWRPPFIALASLDSTCKSVDLEQSQGRHTVAMDAQAPRPAAAAAASATYDKQLQWQALGQRKLQQAAQSERSREDEHCTFAPKVMMAFVYRFSIIGTSWSLQLMEIVNATRLSRRQRVGRRRRAERRRLHCRRRSPRGLRGRQRLRPRKLRRP